MALMAFLKRKPNATLLDEMLPFISLTILSGANLRDAWQLELVPIPNQHFVNRGESGRAAQNYYDAVQLNVYEAFSTAMASHQFIPYLFFLLS